MEKSGFDTQYGVQPTGPPISVQPQSGAFSGFSGIGACPPGLEYLAQVDQLIVKQKVDVAEVVTGCERQNRYEILNSQGQPVFFVTEESECCERQWCGPVRGLLLHITDNANQEVMRLSKELGCMCCWCADSLSCAMAMGVEAPVGSPLGYVRQQKYCCNPYMTIRTTDDNVVASVRGPCCPWKCCEDVIYDIYSGASEDTAIGKVAKVWTGAGGALAEMFTHAQTFSVNFPMDMDVRTKALFIGAVFLMDFMFYENKNE